MQNANILLRQTVVFVARGAIRAELCQSGGGQGANRLPVQLMAGLPLI